MLLEIPGGIFILAYSYRNMARRTKKVGAGASGGRRADLAAIGRRVRELRGAERQDDFAPVLDITQGQLSKIERGLFAPSVEVLLKLCERTGRSVDWILRGEEG